MENIEVNSYSSAIITLEDNFIQTSPTKITRKDLYKKRKRYTIRRQNKIICLFCGEYPAIYRPPYPSNLCLCNDCYDLTKKYLPVLVNSNIR